MLFGVARGAMKIAHLPRQAGAGRRRPLQRQMRIDGAR
jgi:hypothetical protein